MVDQPDCIKGVLMLFLKRSPAKSDRQNRSVMGAGFISLTRILTATNTILLCKVNVKKVGKHIHQVKACQQVWASTVKSFEIAFKSLAPNPPNQEALNTLESTLFITRAKHCLL